MSEVVGMKSPCYVVGSLYRIVNERLSLKWEGPLELFLETFSTGRPTGVEVCQAAETIIQRKHVSLSFKFVLAHPGDKAAHSELESILNARSAGRGDFESCLPSGDLLRIGAFLGDLPLVERSLAAGAEIDSEGFGKMTALHWAVVRDNVEIARSLVERGAQYQKANECAWDIFDLAACNKAAKTLGLARELGFSQLAVAFGAMLTRWNFDGATEGLK